MKIFQRTDVAIKALAQLSATDHPTLTYGQTTPGLAAVGALVWSGVGYFVGAAPSTRYDRPQQAHHRAPSRRRVDGAGHGCHGPHAEPGGWAAIGVPWD